MVASSYLRPLYGGSLQITVTGSSTNPYITWPASVNIKGFGLVNPEFTVQDSGDLIHWQTLGGKLKGVDPISPPNLGFRPSIKPGPHFFRLIADPSSIYSQEVVSGGADVYSYNSSLAQQLSQLGTLSLSNFATLYPSGPYLPQISFDPTTADFWNEFNTDPAVWTAEQGTNNPGRSWNDFRLTPAEMSKFMTNGFVVSERMGSISFAQSYYRIFNDDLPVFITTDSILHAWHRTFDNMLEELEELEMATLMENILTTLSTNLPQLYADYQARINTNASQPYPGGPLDNSFQDADFFLTVARSLWTGSQVSSSLGLPSVDQQTGTALQEVASLSLQNVVIFGTNRWVDFSQFTVRGHYLNSPRLSRYFQTMMWCEMIDLRLATLDERDAIFSPDPEDYLREFGTAIVLNALLAQPGGMDDWASMDQIGRAFFGVTASLTPPQLAALLAAANIQMPWDVSSPSVLANLQGSMLSGELAFPVMSTDPSFAANGELPERLPQSFTIFGQKFASDSWAMTEVTWNRTGNLMRRKSSGLDVAFSVLGNNQAVPFLIDRIAATNGVPWRDGYACQTNFAAVRGVIDSRDPAVWTNNVYNAWLGAIRTLSLPTTSPQFPEAMRTHAWADKTLTTQLASWTELRHDTILYTQPAYTPLILCGYPSGFVEPVPAFWNQMEESASLAAEAIATFPLTGWVGVPDRDPSDPFPVSYNLSMIQASEVSSLTNFAAQMEILKTMAEKELAQQPFSMTESNYLKSVMENVLDPYFGELYSGWYPQLFYQNVYNSLPGDDPDGEGSNRWDAMVADIDTDLPDFVDGDPGAVINDAVGNVHMMMIAVDNGPNRMVYAGPVLSYYEFETDTNIRLTDDEWKQWLKERLEPSPPEWTSDYLVPGGFTVPPGF